MAVTSTRAPRGAQVTQDTLGLGIRPRILAGSLLSLVGAYLSVRFLTRYFEDRSLQPSKIYCFLVETACPIWFGVTS